jgi:hypothetical protein
MKKNNNNFFVHFFMKENHNNIKFSYRLRVWLKKIGIKFIISITFTVTIGLVIRYFINEYLDIDIIRDILNPISIFYYFFMAICSKFTHQVLVEYLIDIFAPNLMMPAGGDGGYGNVPPNPNLPPNPYFPPNLPSSDNLPSGNNNNFPGTGLNNYPA